MASNGPNKRDPVHRYLRWIAGTVASGVLMYLTLLSLQEGVRLQTEVILGLLALITLLLYGADALVAVIEAWRGE